MATFGTGTPELKRGTPGCVTTVPSVAAIREGTGLSQPRFAELLRASLRTLQEWKQGRRAPSGAARTLLLITASTRVRWSTCLGASGASPESRSPPRLRRYHHEASAHAQARQHVGESVRAEEIDRRPAREPCCTRRR